MAKHATTKQALDAQRASQRDWYRRNKTAHKKLVLANNAKRLARIRAIVDAIKAQPCADCNRTFDPVCMDFDHRPGEVKVMEISRLVATRASEALIFAEIAKCDLVCACCHRLRSKARWLAAG